MALSTPGPQDTPMRLLRILGLGFGLAVTVGNTIGGGILRTPGNIAQLLPHETFFVGIWLIGALYAFLGANALSELGTMLPRSGGQFVFARRAFGDYAAFVVGWMDWISTCASTAAIGVVLGESIAWMTGTPATLAPGIAAGVVVFFLLLLIAGTSIGDTAQRLTSLLKAVALMALVVACLVVRGTPPVSVATPVATATGFAAFLLAAQSVIYAYDGWSGPIYFSEELQNPDRDIPRSMFLGLASVAIIYVLINFAFARAVPLSALASSNLAAATVAGSLFGASGAWLVRLVVIVSLPSAINACLLMASRVIFALSRDGLGIPLMSKVRRNGAPSMGLIASAAVTIAFLASGTFDQIIAIAAFFFVATYSLSFIAVFLLRRREPNARRPYRAVGHPWTTGFVLLGSLGFLVSAVVADRRNSVIALGILVVSYPVFRLMRQPATEAISVASADPYL
jgi:APA family basic amino acid/polyamine antiporter